MDLKRLRYFAAVAEAGSFSRGAAALHLSQPAISRQVLLLERELGLSLLVRNGRGVEPSDAGRALLVHARGIFEAAERARVDMLERRSTPQGRVTIGLPPRVAQVLAADLVTQFHAELPDAVLSVVEGLSLRLREWLLAGRLDMAILFDPPPSPQIAAETLAREPLVLVGPEPVPARLRLADVAARRLVMPAAPNALRQLLEQHARPLGLALNVVAEVDSVQTVLSLVARGAASTVLPRSAVEPWSRGGRRPHVAAIVAPVIRNRVVLAVARARPATRATRTMQRRLRELARQHYGGTAGDDA